MKNYKTILNFILIIIIYSFFYTLVNTKKEHFGLNTRYRPYNRLDISRYLRNRDRSMIYDPLIAPERRYQHDQYPFELIYNDLINYPTRGYPDNYQQLGLLTRKEDEKMLQLFGRATFPGSNQWEYFARSEKEGFINKIPIYTKNQKEIFDNDSVEVLGMNGVFVVKLYNYNTPRYNPYF
jgi:hypothetical protein